MPCSFALTIEVELHFPVQGGSLLSEQRLEPRGHASNVTLEDRGPIRCFGEGDAFYVSLPPQCGLLAVFSEVVECK